MENNFIVYKYTSPSNKIYIGQTCNSLQKRAEGNGSGYKNSPHFYNAILKYGFKNFVGEILQDNLNSDEADYWEKYYINLYRSYDKNYGYNIALGGGGFNLSEDTMQKITDRMKNHNPMKNPEIVQKVREKNIGKQISDEQRTNMGNSHKKQVLCVETGIVYPSRNDAAKTVGVSGSGIGRAINGEQETSAGYHWRYV